MLKYLKFGMKVLRPLRIMSYSRTAIGNKTLNNWSYDYFLLNQSKTTQKIKDEEKDNQSKNESDNFKVISRCLVQHDRKICSSYSHLKVFTSSFGLYWKPASLHDNNDFNPCMMVNNLVATVNKTFNDLAYSTGRRNTKEHWTIAAHLLLLVLFIYF